MWRRKADNSAVRKLGGKTVGWWGRQEMEWLLRKVWGVTNAEHMEVDVRENEERWG